MKKIDWVKWGVIVQGIALIAIIIQIMNIPIPRPTFHDEEYSIYTLTAPESPEILPNMITSPLYYVELDVDTPTNARYESTLKFLIKVTNKGKKEIKDPKFRVFIMDPFGNMRGFYPENGTTLADTISIDRKFYFTFEMPSEDQKVVGVWKILVFLFDGNDASVVSYNISEFNVVSDSTNSLIFGYISGALVAATIIVFIYRISSLIRKEYTKNEDETPSDDHVD
ncbi:MAG TPA: hypothetical protein PLZ42_00880 [Methanothrix sp.]|nr:hypothetical protein [Methanothrix sp.]